jgi:hypothetical protein
MKTWPDIEMKHSSYDGSKGTVFLIHGFMSTGNDTWMEDMKNAYLNNVSDMSLSSATLNIISVPSRSNMNAEETKHIKFH